MTESVKWQDRFDKIKSRELSRMKYRRNNIYDVDDDDDDDELVDDDNNAI